MAVLLVLVIITITSIGSTHIDKNEGTAMDSTMTSSIRQVMSVPEMKDEYTFAGERIPIEDFDVKERLQRELIVNTYYHSSTILNILRSHRYFGKIEEILRIEGVPTDFKFLAVAESGLENVTSPAGASGYWQFMPSVARYYGLEVNDYIDERYNLEKATHAACKLLKDYYDRFDSWLLAAVGYNAGGTRLASTIEREGTRNYYEMNLNAETNRYIFRIIALKDILQDPEYYGFYINENDYYKPLTDYFIVEVNETIENLGDFAAKYGITYRDLKIYNPWMLSYKLPDSSGKLYKIKIPKN